MLTLLTNLPRDVLINQLKDGVVLLFLGMGFVFVFLALLIYITKGISKVCSKISPASEPVAKKAPTQTRAASAPSAGAKDSEVAAAIAAAYEKTKE